MDFKKMFIENKKEVIVLTLLLVLFGAVSSGIFYNKGNRNFNEGVKQLEASYMKNHKEEYEDLKKDINKAEEELKILKIEINSASEEKDEIETYIKNNKEKIDKIDEYETLVEELDDEKSSLENEISSLSINKIALEKEKDEIQDEIDKLNGKLVEAAGSPIELQPGMWFQDIDEIPVGRYTVSNGDSNFFVSDEEGYTYVNIILDDSDSGWGVTEYTFVLTEGAIIETDSGCTLTPVN